MVAFGNIVESVFGKKEYFFVEDVKLGIERNRVYVETSYGFSPFDSGHDHYHDVLGRDLYVKLRSLDSGKRHDMHYFVVLNGVALQKSTCFEQEAEPILNSKGLVVKLRLGGIDNQMEYHSLSKQVRRLQ